MAVEWAQCFAAWTFNSIGPLQSKFLRRLIEPPKRPSNDSTTKPQSAARLDHENIARVYFIGEEDGWQFIAFEFVDGQNIRDMVSKSGPLPISDALQYAMQIAEALDHASDQGVVHRDIKPSNIIVTVDGRAKLVDMGLARYEHLEAHDEDLTASGRTLGTFDYISPEQAENPRQADVRSDIYSLGCTLYHMLVGAPPFPGGAPFEKLLRHKNEAIPDARESRSDLPDSLLAVLHRMLSKSPDDRYQRPLDLVRDLRLLYNEDALGPAIVRPAPKESKTSNQIWNHIPWIVPSFLLLAIVLAVQFGTSDNFPTFMSEEESQRQEALDQLASEEADSGKSSADTNDDLTDRGDKDTGSSASGGSTDSSPSNNGGDLTQDASKIVVTKQPSRIHSNEVGSLIAAVEMANQNDEVQLIELRFDGSMTSPPIRVEDTRLEIRAAVDSNPTIVFKPEDDFLISRLDMVRINGGVLTIRGVHLEANFSEVAPKKWTMFQLHRHDSLRLFDTQLTLRGPNEEPIGFGSDASFVDLKPELENDFPRTFGSPIFERENTFVASSPSERASIILENCVVRGEAVMLRMAQPISVNLDWQNGLFASSERFAHLGTQQADSDIASDFVFVDFNLANVTAATDKGLMMINSGEAFSRRDLAIAFVASNSMFISTEAALIVQQGPPSLKNDRRQFTFEGKDNAYLTSGEMYRVEHGSDSTIYDFEQWSVNWPKELRPEILFELPFEPVYNIPAHRRGVTNYSSDQFLRDGVLKGMDAEALQRWAPTKPSRAES